ncbi:hypothetical protein SETIT_2G428100v2 [Setaria italica]|uniref:Uncharacterized protein n=1 Tax=Setaria italica TaxID=4555 RepID=A0A368Q8Z8_SETIT|nr:hypothetical protein SETIT_2G428100v2 [Setaria italica]
MLRMKFPTPKDSPFPSGTANLAGEEKDDRAAAADSVVENGSLSPQRHRIDRGVRLGRPLAWPVCISPPRCSHGWHANASAQDSVGAGASHDSSVSLARQRGGLLQRSGTSFVGRAAVEGVNID